MAILQCQIYFDDYPKIKLIDSIDTALSAKDIADKKQYGVGAIASNLAAKKYGLEILAEEIETDKNNYTRFLILHDKNGTPFQDTNVNKASLSFALADQIGSLSKILSIFSFHEINLTKIQSMPIIGKDWEYQFFIDVDINDYERYQHVLAAIAPFTSDLHILGEYYKGKKLLD
jgi:prephenate dehydratase